MTERYTMQEAIELARENGFNDLSEEYHPIFCQELTRFVNTAVTRKLAEKELEAVRLRDGLSAIRTEAYFGRNGERPNMQIVYRLANEALSTPSSTKHLDEYVAARMAESEDRRDAWISVDDSLPPFINGKDYSDNVLAICNGRLSICNRYFEGGYWYWCRANSVYGDLRHAECEFDDDYTVTHWMPLPKTPAIEAEKVRG